MSEIEMPRKDNSDCPKIILILFFATIVLIIIIIMEWIIFPGFYVLEEHNHTVDPIEKVVMKDAENWIIRITTVKDKYCWDQVDFQLLDDKNFVFGTIEAPITTNTTDHVVVHGDDRPWFCIGGTRPIILNTSSGLDDKSDLSPVRVLNETTNRTRLTITNSSNISGALMIMVDVDVDGLISTDDILYFYSNNYRAPDLEMGTGSKFLVMKVKSILSETVLC